ncbi:MAG: hypothetical protein LBP80_01430 [Treponema sp.]|nr:hypothetical protein [Treponema sp.]
MKHATPASLASKWKKAFPKKEEDASTAVKNLPAKNDEPETAGPALALIRKEPVTFRLSRLENPEDFERMRFVVKACARTADVPFKTVLHVEQTRTGSRLVACDGLRLHLAEISKKIKSGDYKPRVAKDCVSLGVPLEGVRFPAWAKAIPEKTEKRGVINLEKTGMGKDRKETEKLSIVFNSFVRQTGEPVNLRYLEDLTKREWTIYCQGEKQKAIVLKEGHGKMEAPDVKSPLAVILPIPKAA